MDFYGRNKAPFPIFLRQGWLRNPERNAGFLKFLDWLLTKDDVFVVTIREVIKFMRNPRPVSKYQEDRCHEEIAPSIKCTRPVQCIYKRVKIVDAIKDRWLRQIAVFQHSVQDHLPPARPVENNNHTDVPPAAPPKTDLKSSNPDTTNLRHVTSSAKVGELRRQPDPSYDEHAIKAQVQDQRAKSNGDLLRNHASVQDSNQSSENLRLKQVVIFFMICWFPLYTLNCVKAFCAHCDPPQWVFDSLIILSHLNSALNPFLYAYRMKDFREALQRLLRCKHPAPLTDVRTLCHRNGRSPENHAADDPPGRVAVTVVATQAC
ncbi:serotonin receptor, putative [Ixodes scapularis]|uniref:Serotonin receptor, putative n=1 Tax=Ixodes scapularis TaxID=6945 RepID=B7PD23_IXOSC|nr:serotonin receptor, putative [Ixodes scapularis]|eukprot:XP_002410573.1 serotonin receptor, putative [Ixodes scapularis]